MNRRDLIIGASAVPLAMMAAPYAHAGRGYSIAGVEVNAKGPMADGFEGRTNETGEVRMPMTDEGLFSIRAKYVEPMAGTFEKDGESQEYSEIRHYSTLAVSAKPVGPAVEFEMLAEMPRKATSFGGAVLNGDLYVYGGHAGTPHAYSWEEQGKTLRRLPLGGQNGEWSELATGPHLQGLAMVADGRRLYRLGGFTAKNDSGDDQDLYSQASAAAFDPESGEWTELPPLPEPRSSHDAAVLDGKLYVAGGWSMQGDADAVWHDTVWRLDTAADSPTWELATKAPFKRRALAVAAHDGKLYVVGGMNEDGGPTPKVGVFDPANGEWSEGPKLIGTSGLTGFGVSAFSVASRTFDSGTWSNRLARSTRVIHVASSIART